MSKAVESRRARAKEMLEAQLKRGTKPEKVNGKTTSKMIPLTRDDISRIHKEIEAINNPKKKRTEA